MTTAATEALGDPERSLSALRTDAAGNSLRDDAQDTGYSIDTFDSQGFPLTTELTAATTSSLERSLINLILVPLLCL